MPSRVDHKTKEALPHQVRSQSKSSTSAGSSAVCSGGAPEQVFADVDCSVLVVNSPGFDSPVPSTVESRQQR